MMAKKKYGRFSNKLTDAEAERLAILIEECGEVVQIACKILRHGFASYHPSGGPANREELEKELGDLACAAELLVRARDVRKRRIAEHAGEKIDSLRKYTHHQPAKLLDGLQAQLDMWVADVAPRERA